MDIQITRIQSEPYSNSNSLARRGYGEADVCRWEIDLGCHAMHRLTTPSQLVAGASSTTYILIYTILFAQFPISSKPE
jgi:hypothetical protein